MACGWMGEGRNDVVLVFEDGLALGRREQLIEAGTPRKGSSRPFAWGAFELNDELTPRVRVFSLRMEVELEDEFCSVLLQRPSCRPSSLADIAQPSHDRIEGIPNDGVDVRGRR